MDNQDQEDDMGNGMSLIIVAGDSGVYVGYADGGAQALGADGRVVLTSARHLRRYYVAGRTGDGSAGDLAARGLDPSSPSVSDVVSGDTVLVGVRRAFDVAEDAVASFGCSDG
jgi:hypothetical protein